MLVLNLLIMDGNSVCDEAEFCFVCCLNNDNTISKSVIAYASFSV